MHKFLYQFQMWLEVEIYKLKRQARYVPPISNAQ